MTDARGLFVTGTGTGVGKTTCAATLAYFLRQQQIDVAVMKPVETGIDDPGHLGPDAQLLRWASASKEPAEAISPWRYRTPAAPATAAKQEQRPIDYTQLVEQIRTMIERHSFSLIEGAGGLLVPLAGGLLMADLIRDLKLPLLVVCDARLGSINHSLLTLMVARQLELSVAGYLINRMPEKPSVAEKMLPHDLSSLTHADLLGVFPELPLPQQQQVQQFANELPQQPLWPLLKRTLHLDAGH